MKIRIQLTTLLLFFSIVSYGQALQTIKTYHDPFTKRRLHEVYTVKQNTGIKHGNYKSYFEDGFLECVANFKNNVLHGACEVHERFFLRIITGGYNNGEKNGEWCYYARNRITGKKEHIEKKEFYKDGEVIWETEYYEPNESNKQQVKSHKEPVNDGKYKWCRKSWYPNGALLEEFCFGYDDNKSIEYYEDGGFKHRVEDGIVYTYSNDGKTLLNKKMKGGEEEIYENGLLKYSKRAITLNGKESEYELIEYKNGDIISKTIIDTDGRNVEEKKREQALKSQYEQAEKELNELLRPYLQQRFENKSSDWGVQGKQDACIKQRYYYDKRIEELRSAYYLRKSTVNKIVDKSKDVTSGELNGDKLKRIQDYIVEIKENYIPQKNNLTSIKSGLDNLITSLQLIDCNFIDIKVIHKGSGHTNYTLSVEIKAKKKLFEEYSKVSDHLMDNITNDSSDIFITSIQQYNVISSNFLKWKNTNTSDIEKQLKKAKTVQEKLEIFLSVGAN